MRPESLIGRRVNWDDGFAGGSATIARVDCSSVEGNAVFVTGSGNRIDECDITMVWPVSTGEGSDPSERREQLAELLAAAPVDEHPPTFRVTRTSVWRPSRTAPDAKLTHQFHVRAVAHNGEPLWATENFTHHSHALKEAEKWAGWSGGRVVDEMAIVQREQGNDA